MNTTRFIIVTLAVLAFPVRTSSQHINEFVFPRFPLKYLSSGIITTDHGFHIAGTNYEEWYSQVFDWGGATRRPYFLTLHSNRLSTPVFLPDTMFDVYRGFSFEADRWKISVVSDSNNNPCVMWSKVRSYMSDVPPAYLGTPDRKYATMKNSILDKIISVPNGMNPSMQAEHHGTVHYVWEQFTPDTESVGHIFCKTFSSSVLYKRMAMDGSEYTDAPELVGKGFYPEIRLRNGKPYILFFAADTSSADSVYLQVNREQTMIARVLCYVNPYSGSQFDHWNPFIVQTPVLTQFSWNVDTSGGVQIVWYHSSLGTKKIHILHLKEEWQPFHDTSLVFPMSSSISQHLFTKNGEIRILQLDAGGMLHSFSSLHGSNASETKTHQLDPAAALLRTYFADADGNGHALVENAGEKSGLYVVKHIGTDTAKIVLLSGEYLVHGSVHVDSTNTVWMTGKRDSTYVLLSFNLDEVGQHTDFTFPLRVGNEWYYERCPDTQPLCVQPQRTIVKALRDTVMATGMSYIELSAKGEGSIFLRKDRLEVFQYEPADSSEWRRFDFTKTSGDTIDAKKKVVLQSRSFDGKEFLFAGFGPSVSGTLFWDSFITVHDSIGITGSYGIGDVWKLIGGKVNGKTFGTVLAVEKNEDLRPASFSLSQNYPNPFNPSTSFEYHIPQKSFVTLKIYDAIGRETAVLVNEEKDAGSFTASWNAERYSSGLYFARMRTKDYSSVKKIMLIK